MSITTATYIIQFKFLVIFTQDYDKFNLVSWRKQTLKVINN